MRNMLPPAERCETMDDVRRAIDTLDQDIVALLAERMRYIDAAARIKSARDTVRDETRKADVLAKVEQTARDMGLPPELAADLYEKLIEYSIAHEMALFDARQDSAATA